MKKVIGILPEGKLFDPEKGSISDNYRLGNNYVKCMAEAGASPVCLAPVDGYLSVSSWRCAMVLSPRAAHRCGPTISR